MTTSTRRSGDHVQPIRGPGELAQAIPYLIGYHPAESVVLVGLHRGRLVVTARLDLADPGLGPGSGGAPDGMIVNAVARAAEGGATEFVVVVFTEAVEASQLIDGVTRVAVHAVACGGGQLIDVLHVRSGRCWSHLSGGPPDGWDLDAAPSPFVAEATVAGAAPRPDRAAVEASLDPCPAHVRAELVAPLAAAEDAGMSAVLDGGRRRHDRAVRRAVLAAVRACHEPGWTPPGDGELARLAVALTSLEIRDEVWLTIEGGSLDGRPLMLELARRCPSPYDAAPLFLYGWACWRAGNGMLAGVAAQRAMAADPGCRAARLLLDAVDHGLDPHSVPKLRRPRRAR